MSKGIIYHIFILDIYTTYTAWTHRHGYVCTFILYVIFNIEKCNKIQSEFETIFIWTLSLFAFLVWLGNHWSNQWGSPKTEKHSILAHLPMTRAVRICMRNTHASSLKIFPKPGSVIALLVRRHHDNTKQHNCHI